MILKVVLYAVAVLVVVVAVVTAIGYAQPHSHVASGEAVLASPPSDVFARIGDVARYPDWRPDIAKVDVIASEPLRWREHAGGDVVTYEVVERAPVERLVVRIVDTGLPFGGTWTYELSPRGPGTRLVITERGEVYNPIFRFMARFVFSPTATIQRYLAALQAVE